MTNPTPTEIKAARLAAGLTQTAAAELVYSTLIAWQKWEQNERNMPQAKWELFNLKIKKGENKMEFNEKAQKSEEIAAQQRAVKKQMDGLAWKQHSNFPASWTEERNGRITALGKEYDRLGEEYRAVWNGNAEKAQ